MNTRKYTRINEDFLDDHQIDVQNDVDIYEIVQNEVEALLNNEDVSIDLCDLPDAYYKVTDRDELEQLVTKCALKYGNDCSLNWIDVSHITNMSGLFSNSAFNGDISRWNVSRVINMSSMFRGCIFNHELSKWDVRKVTNMSNMFRNSAFNKDISDWNTESLENAESMFYECDFTGDISKWNLKNL